MSNSLKSKVFATNWDAWNRKWVPLVASPFLAALGVVVGLVLDGHFASSELGQTLVMALFAVVTMMVGFTLLALID